LFYRVLDCFPWDLEVLLKIERQETNGAHCDQWQRYDRVCAFDTLSEAIRSHEELVFLDGGMQISVRCAGGGDYLVLDEHAILFLYSDDEGFEDLCRELGFEECAQPLLYEAGHWHVRPDNAKEHAESFVSRLGLVAV